MVIMALILFTLCQPEFIKTNQVTDPPSVTILRDVSGSMATRDVQLSQHDVVTREEWLEERMKSNFLAALKARNVNVNMVDFGMSASATNAKTSIADGTDIGDALERTLAQRARKNLKAVLMMGDGDWNHGDPPIQAARQLALRDGSPAVRHAASLLVTTD